MKDETIKEVTEEMIEVEESKIKTAWNKIKKPASYVISIVAGIAIGVLASTRNSCDSGEDLDDVIEVTE